MEKRIPGIRFSFQNGFAEEKKMLTETRQDEILQMLEEKGSVTVQELTEKFRASESTIRRDLIKKEPW